MSAPTERQREKSTHENDREQGTMTTMILRRSDLGPPAHYTEQDAGLSNFDHEIDEGCEEGLRSGPFFARYAAWDFNGLVWVDAEGSFSCQVWRYHAPVATVVAPTLDDLMCDVSDEFGWD